jgi:hypothetical protein
MSERELLVSPKGVTDIAWNIEGGNPRNIRPRQRVSR